MLCKQTKGHLTLWCCERQSQMRFVYKFLGFLFSSLQEGVQRVVCCLLSSACSVFTPLRSACFVLIDFYSFSTGRWSGPDPRVWCRSARRPLRIVSHSACWPAVTTGRCQPLSGAVSRLSEAGSGTDLGPSAYDGFKLISGQSGHRRGGRVRDGRGHQAPGQGFQ